MALHADPSLVEVGSIQTFNRVAKLLVAERWNRSTRSTKVKLTIPNNAVAKKVDCIDFTISNQGYKGQFTIVSPDHLANSLIFEVQIPFGETFKTSGSMMIYEPISLEERPVPKPKKTNAKKAKEASKKKPAKKA